MHCDCRRPALRSVAAADLGPSSVQHWNMHTQQTLSICITFVQRRPNVLDVGLTLYECYTNVLCLLGKGRRWLSLSPTAVADLGPPSVPQW